MRLLAKYRAGGRAAAAAAVRRRYRQRQRRVSPVLWSWFGPLSALLARQIRPLSPPVLILSLPRSGSSWVGEILGNADNALYLREPITQTYLAAGNERTTIAVDPENPPAVYRQAAARAFTGLPLFPPNIVHFPAQWSLAGRRQRRLVIKEVNPRATAWFIRRFEPRILFLLRHPAAIGLSYRKLGWWGDEPDVWRRIGHSYGLAWQAAMDSLAGYPEQQIVYYEQLCAEPVALFKSLCEFAGLDWSRRLELFVRQKSAVDVSGSKTGRDSQAMIDSWRGEITAAELADLQAGYSAFDLPWYRSPSDWQAGNARV